MTHPFFGINHCPLSYPTEAGLVGAWHVATIVQQGRGYLLGEMVNEYSFCWSHEMQIQVIM